MDNLWQLHCWESPSIRADPRLCLPQLRARSYASRNQLAVSQKEIDAGAELEWERRYLTTLGVANKRLYEMRIQTSAAAFQKAEVRRCRVR